MAKQSDANQAARSLPPWHPCDDGLIPIAEAVERFCAASVRDLPERIKCQITSPSYVLAGDANRNAAGPGVKAPPRVEMVCRWLTTNGYVADGMELHQRWPKLIDDLKQWEEGARCDTAPIGSNSLFASESTQSEYCRIVDSAHEFADWCRQLASTVRAKLKAAGVTHELPPVESPARAGGNATGRVSTNALMMEALTKSPESQGWSIRRFSREIKRSNSSIQGCGAWRRLEEMRADQKARRALDRSRGAGRVRRRKK